jgi:hypothetical protein
VRWIGFVVITLLAVLGASTAGATVTSSDLDAIARELTSSGRYLEFPSNDALDESIDTANARGVAFAWLDADGDAEDPAAELADRVDGSQYRTVVVLTNTSIGAWSNTLDDATIERALDASGDQFAAGAVADGLESFSATLAGNATTATTTTTGGSSPPATSTDGGGIGLGTVLLVALLGGGAFLLFRSLRKRSKTRKQAELDLEEDRAEIKEQLRDNADHVLELGDRVIASAKPDLMATYEQASASYQEVSGAIDDASTAVEIDRLDDLIDEAEWQFESIEAALEGRPKPPSPAEVEAQARAAAEQDAAGNDDGPPSSDPTPPAPSRRDGPAPTPRQRTPYPQTQRRGGGLGGILGGILGSIVLGGGGMGGMGGTGSRRTQRRRTQYPSGGSMSSGGLGGGVLRRGGSSSSRRRSGGGGSRSTRRGGGGSRRF